MPKIVVLDTFPADLDDFARAGFADLGELVAYHRTAPHQIAERIGDARCVLVNKARIGADVLAEATALEYIGVLATGFDGVDGAAARACGISVTNVPAYGTAGVAQFAIALLLEICHRVGHHDHAVHQGRWGELGTWCFWDYPQIELAGKTMGIIGFGRIGRATARIAQALGMNVVVHDAVPPAPAEARHVSLPELYRIADVVVLHCPTTPATAGMIDRAALDQMKDGVILINNARGALVVEADLAEALNSGKVRAAGLDVVAVEPIRDESPLLTAKNCVITPHMSWASREARDRLMGIAADNLRQFLAGTPVNVVNP